MRDAMIKRQIIIGTPRYAEFYTFIMDTTANHHLQTFILLCSGFYTPDEVTQKLEDIMEDFEFFLNNGYTFSQLFDKTLEWYSFYKENAYPCGRRRENEKRRGVTRRYADDIMILRNRLNIDLEKAIVLWSSINYRIFCINTLTNPYYGRFNRS